MSLTYLDTSAFLKTVVTEPETTALRTYLEGRPRRVSSALLRAEALRAIRRQHPQFLRHIGAALDRVHLVPIRTELLHRAGMLEPRTLRTLDAIHLASALTLAPDIDVVVTYDVRLREAAELLGLPVSSPI